MFDNLRDDASNAFYEEDDSQFFLEEDEIDSSPAPAPVKKKTKKRKSAKLLGMTDIQRFIIAVMLMVAVCTLGAMCLLITGKIGLM